VTFLIEGNVLPVVEHWSSILRLKIARPILPGGLEGRCLFVCFGDGRQEN